MDQTSSLRHRHSKTTWAVHQRMLGLVNYEVPCIEWLEEAQSVQIRPGFRR